MEADIQGLKIMQDNHIDQRGMVKLLKLLKDESAETPALMKYLSTHPETDEQNLGTVNNSDKTVDLEGIFVKIKSALNAAEGQKY